MPPRKKSYLPGTISHNTKNSSASLQWKKPFEVSRAYHHREKRMQVMDDIGHAIEMYKGKKAKIAAATQSNNALLSGFLRRSLAFNIRLFFAVFFHFCFHRHVPFVAHSGTFPDTLRRRFLLFLRLCSPCLRCVFLSRSLLAAVSFWLRGCFFHILQVVVLVQRARFYLLLLLRLGLCFGSAFLGFVLRSRFVLIAASLLFIVLGELCGLT